MRVFKIIGLFILCFLFGCKNTDDEYQAMNDILLQAETIYQHPDGERYDTYSSDTLQILQKLMDAEAFFKNKKNHEKEAKAALYIGYAQKESNDKTSAMSAFKKAEYYSSINSDSLTMARAQFNIARFLIDENEFDDLLKTANLADNNFGNHYDERAFVNNLIALSYMIQKDYINAEIYLKNALDHADKGNSTRAKRKILNNYSVFYREQGKYDKAIDYLLQLKTLELDSAQKIMFNINMGILYLYDNQYDSAYFYTQKALDLTKYTTVKPETEVSIYFSLYYIAKKQENYQLSLSYLEKHEALRYNILKENEKKSLYSIQQQYDYETLRNKMNQNIIQKQRIILIISLLLLIASMITIGLLVRQKKILNEDERIRNELEMIKEEMQSSIKPKIVEKELTRQLHLIISANHIAETADDFKKEWSALVYRINSEKTNMFDAAMAAIERFYPDMYATIRSKYPDLSETESKVMLLSCSDLKNNEIARILGLSVHSVNKSRSEINKRLSDPYL